MISAAHEHDRPVLGGSDDHPSTSTVPAPAAPLDVPAPRRAPGGEPVADPAQLPSRPLDTTPPSAFRVAGAPEGADGTGASEDAGLHLDRVAADLESGAAALAWALRLVLLGAIGLVVLLLAVL